MAKNKYETHVAPRLEEVKDWVRNGATDKEIWERLGISEASFYNYKNQNLEFLESLKETKDFVDGKVENALLQNALKGNITAQIFWLKNRRPDKWRDRLAEDNGSNGGNAGEPVFEYVFKDMSIKDENEN